MTKHYSQYFGWLIDNKSRSGNAPERAETWRFFAA